MSTAQVTTTTVIDFNGEKSVFRQSVEADVEFSDLGHAIVSSVGRPGYQLDPKYQIVPEEQE